MRVIAGSARGTRLFAPRGMETRPTADRVREALFNVIQNQFEINGLRVLDICAGTGGLGIEALSRGAACCSFVEISREALKCLKRNLHASHCFDRASLMEMNLTRALPLLAGRGRQIRPHIPRSALYFESLYNCIADNINRWASGSGRNSGCGNSQSFSFARDGGEVAENKSPRVW